MADLSDVENALVSAIAAAVYPSGSGGASAIGAPCPVYRGWPNASKLDVDLLSGRVNITVFTRAGMTRNTTRYPNEFQDGAVVAPLLTVTNTYNTVTFAGAAGVAANCGIRTNVNSWVYTATTADTPQTVAAALGALIPGATVSGATITLPGTPVGLGALVGGFASALAETRRQVQGFLVTIWAPNPTLRDTAASVVDAALAQINFLTLADGTAGRLIYHNSFVNDVPTKDALWRRDLTYSVEYVTSATMNAATALFGVLNVQPTDTSGDDLVTFSVENAPPINTPPVNFLTDSNGNPYVDAAGNPIITP